jgi:hypothetical protein
MALLLFSDAADRGDATEEAMTPWATGPDPEAMTPKQ